MSKLCLKLSEQTILGAKDEGTLLFMKEDKL